MKINLVTVNQKYTIHMAKKRGFKFLHMKDIFEDFFLVKPQNQILLHKGKMFDDYDLVFEILKPNDTLIMLENNKPNVSQNLSSLLFQYLNTNYNNQSISDNIDEIFRTDTHTDANSSTQLSTNDNHNFNVITLQDREAIERLVQLGYTFEESAVAYFVCDKNEDLAANYLMD